MSVGNGRPRLVDVARLSGTSTAVVSAVVNGRAGTTIRVSESTRRRVLSAANELGYVANPVAQRLARGQNRLIGIFTHEAVFPIDRRSFYYPFLVGCEQEAEVQGYDLALFTSTSVGRGKRMIYRDGVNRLQVASGSVLLGWAESTDEIRRLSDEGYAFTYVGRRAVDGVEISYAAADYAGATREVVRHLVDLGHRTIKFVSSLDEREAGIDRQRGFLQAHHELGLPIDPTMPNKMAVSDMRLDVVAAWMREGYTAIVFEDDILAVPVVEMAREAGWSVPGDLSLAVLGDPLVHTDATPDWLTFAIPRHEMGRQAIRLLIDSFTRPEAIEPRHVVLPCTFREGETAGPPRSRKEGTSP